jgi:hypothetical protein
MLVGLTADMITLGIVLIILVAVLWFFAPVMTAILTVMIYGAAFLRNAIDRSGK